MKRDLEYLSGLHPTDFDVLLAQYPSEKVAEFCTHIRRRVGNKPHVLVAYAWCFYMAVFSGGRWIRSELLKAGSDFWRMERESPKAGEAGLPLGEQGLSFWSFAGTQDGNDIKEAFKERLLTAESLFSADERVDIIEEAKTIFKLSAGLVHDLDQKLGTDFEKLKHMHAAQRHQADKKDDRSFAVTPNPSTMSQAASTWLQKPEVTGAVVALGCLACVVLVKFGY